MTAVPKKRTLAIWVLFLLAILGAILAVIDTLRMFGIFNLPGIGIVNFYGVNWLGAILSAIVAVIWIAVAGQIWRFDPRGWLFVVAIAVINLVFLFLAMIGGNPFQSLTLNILVNVVALVLGLLPSTKANFGVK
jgi:glucose-6-phosphate-specific signal transduction histidine kinase